MGGGTGVSLMLGPGGNRSRPPPFRLKGGSAGDGCFARVIGGIGRAAQQCGKLLICTVGHPPDPSAKGAQPAQP